jgi:hypothetical protein
VSGHCRMATLLFGVLSVACASLPQQTASIEEEARTFMEGYVNELRAGDREAIARRYHSRGAYRVGEGRKVFSPPDSIRAAYARPTWMRPQRLELYDVSYEVLGPNAVVVAGRFEWTTQSGVKLPFSFVELLTRDGDALRIRLEDESRDFRALRERPCRPDSARG